MKRYMFGADKTIKIDKSIDRIVCRANGNKVLHYMLVSVDKQTGGYKIMGELHTKESVEFILNSLNIKKIL